MNNLFHYNISLGFTRKKLTNSSFYTLLKKCKVTTRRKRVESPVFYKHSNLNKEKLMHILQLILYIWKPFRRKAIFNFTGIVNARKLK